MRRILNVNLFPNEVVNLFGKISRIGINKILSLHKVTDAVCFFQCYSLYPASNDTQILYSILNSIKTRRKRKRKKERGVEKKKSATEIKQRNSLTNLQLNVFLIFIVRSSKKLTPLLLL